MEGYEKFLPDGYREGKDKNGNGQEEFDLIFADIFDSDYDAFYDDTDDFTEI